MAAGKNKWGVAYYKQDYPERELEDVVGNPTLSPLNPWSHVFINTGR